MARGVGLVASLCLAGCLGAPPDAIRSDGGEPDEDGGAFDAACPVLPDFPPFADDFQTDDYAWAIEPKPGRSGPGAVTMTVAGGELVFTPGIAEEDDHIWLQSAVFDFSSGRIAMRVSQLTTDSTSEPYLGILRNGVERMFRYDGSHIGTPDGRSLLYLKEVHVWWQVRAEAGLLHYETSTDGLGWSEIEASDPGFGLDAVQFEVGINAGLSATAERGLFAVDDLNLAPLCGS